MGTATATIKTTTLIRPLMIANNAIDAQETKQNARHQISLSFYLANSVMISRGALKNVTSAVKRAMGHMLLVVTKLQEQTF
jgi:hypothetical protein